MHTFLKRKKAVKDNFFNVNFLDRPKNIQAFKMKAKGNELSTLQAGVVRMRKK